MGKNEIRVLNKHYYLRGKMAKEVKEKLDKYYDKSAPSNTTVKRWMQELKFGHTSTNIKPRLGRASDATTPKIIKRFYRQWSMTVNLRCVRFLRM